MLSEVVLTKNKQGGERDFTALAVMHFFVF